MSTQNKTETLLTAMSAYDAAEEGGALPTCLSDAHALAERMEATVLLFDCDGQSIDGLGVWCW